MGGKLAHTFGQNLKLYREANDWSQEVLAARLKKSLSYVSQIELGKRNLSLLIVEALCDQIEVDARAMMIPQRSWPPKLPST